MGSRVRRTVAVLLALELVYLVVGNLFLGTALGQRALHPTSGKWSVDWESAWTVLPGLVHVRGAEVHWSLRRSEGDVIVDRAHLYLVIPSLLRRHVRFLTLQTSGVEARIGVLPTPDEPRPVQRRRGWRTTLGGMEIDDLRHLVLEPFEWRGEGTLRGRLAFQGRGPFTMDFEEVSIVGASNGTNSSEVDGHLLAQNLRLGPYTFAGGTAGEALQTLSGRLALRAQSASLPYLEYYLAGYEWLDLDGVGHVELEVELDAGRLRPGSRLEVASPRLEVDYFDFAVAGSGAIHGVATANGGVDLSAELADFEVALGTRGGAVQGERLQVMLQSAGSAVYEPVSDLTVTIELPSARASDLAIFSSYIPAGAGVQIDRGSAELSASIRYDTGQRTGSGEVSVSGEEIGVGWGDLDLRSDLGLEIQLSAVDFARGKVVVSGSELTLEHLTELVTEGAEKKNPVVDWWGRAQVVKGSIVQRNRGDGPQTAALTARLDTELRDSSIVVDLLTTRVSKLEWFDRFLDVKDVRGGFSIDLHHDGYELRDLEIHGGYKIEILAALDGQAQDRAGVLFLRYSKLSAALALDLTDKARDWKLTRSRDWYHDLASGMDRSATLRALSDGR